MRAVSLMRILLNCGSFCEKIILEKGGKNGIFAVLAIGLKQNKEYEKCII